MAKIQDLSSQLKKDSDNLENWLVLGIYRKIIGDYEGAKEVWEYASAIRPQNSRFLQQSRRALRLLS